jgi:hypothetical protein
LLRWLLYLRAPNWLNKLQWKSYERSGLQE